MGKRRGQTRAAQPPSIDYDDEDALLQGDDDDGELVRQRGTADETAPLLPGKGLVGGRAPVVSVAEVDQEQPDQPDQPDQPKSPRRAVALLLLIIFLMELGGGTASPAFMALLEDVICRDRLVASSSSSTPPLSQFLMDDPRCKSPEIQSRLATVRGWQIFFDAAPCILLVVPYGLLADRRGRKPVMLLAWLGLLLSGAYQLGVLTLLPSAGSDDRLRLVYLGSAFLVIGGFNCTGPALLFTCMADVVPLAQRATSFLLLTVAFLVAEMASAPLSGYLMAKTGSGLVPMLFGLVVIALSMLTILLLPETGKPASPDSSSSKDDNNFITQALSLTRDSFVLVYHFLLARPRIALLMLPLTFFIVGRMAQEVILQYATKRYGMTWSAATSLLAVRSAANLVLAAAVLPLLSYLCVQRWGLSPLKKDLWLARLSGAVGAVGAVMVALAPSPVLLGVALFPFSCAYGFPVMVRSLLNALVEPRHIALVNSMVAILELGGVMVAGPGLNAALSAGLRLGGVWVGLPFMLAGVTFGLAAMIVWVFRLLPKSAADDGEVEGDGETGARLID